MDKKIQFLLEHCFRSKIRERSYYISDFTDNSGREIIKTAKSIENYINVNSVISKVKKECFDKYFKFENFKDKRVLAFLIKQLSDFENFDYGFTKNHKSFEGTSKNTVYGDINRKSLNRYEHLLKYPTNVINDIKCVFNRSGEKVNHPTQKPLELMKYLIKTYSNENDMILDFTMGSGTTCLAAKELNRKFIGIEKEPKYYEIACQRCGF